MLPGPAAHAATPPLAAGVRNVIAVAEYNTSLVQHYNAQQASEYHALPSPRKGADGRLMLCSRGVVPQQVGPSHVDSCRRLEDGVWHPDALVPEMAWRGSGCRTDQTVLDGKLLNPFAQGLPANLQVGGHGT